MSDVRISVDQQGVPSLRRLLRQRTRWAQGNLQAMAHLSWAARADLPLLARLDLAAYLLQPATQGVIGLAFATSIVLALSGVAGFWGDTAWVQLVFFFVLGFGGVVLGCLARGSRQGLGGILRAVAIVPAYAAYSWLIWPVLTRAITRQMVRRRDWAKTLREPVGRPEQPPH